MTDQPQPQTPEQTPEPDIEVPVLHIAHKHVAHIRWLMAEGDRKRTAHLDDTGNPKPGVKPDFDPYRDLHEYLIKNEVVKTFPSSNGKEQYVLTKLDDLGNMNQDDWWLLVASLNQAMDWVGLAQQRAKK